MQSSLILFNGKIFTENGFKQSLAIKGNKIVFVGSNEEIKNFILDKDNKNAKNTKVIDLKGKVVLPAFNDSHTHFVYLALNQNRLNLQNTKSISEVLEKIKNWKYKENEFIVGYNWDEENWRDKRLVCKDDLDNLKLNVPIVLIRVDIHSLVANSIALKKAKVKSKNGILKEKEMEKVLKIINPSKNEMEKCLKNAIKFAHENGITSIQDMVGLQEINLYKKLYENGELKLRVNLIFKEGIKNFIKNKNAIFKSIHSSTKVDEKCFEKSIEPIRPPSKDEWSSSDKLHKFENNEYLRCGSIKLFADGSLGSHTAYLSKPYKDDKKNFGVLISSETQLEKLFKEIDKNNLQIVIHSIGDRATEIVLNAFEKLNRKNKQKFLKNIQSKNFQRNLKKIAIENNNISERRHRIEHLELFSKNQVKKIKKLNLIPSMQPNFIGMFSKLYKKRIGKRKMNRINLLLKNGIKVCFGSDTMPFSPLYGIHYAVNSKNEQRISVEDAIKCYTLNSAFAEFREKFKGTIEEGKIADLVVLNEDIFEVKNIKDIKVNMTIFDGEVVWERN